MKVRIMTVQEFEFKRPDYGAFEGAGFELDDVRDSMMDTTMDLQGVEQETSDEKFVYESGALIRQEIEEIPE